MKSLRISLLFRALLFVLAVGAVGVFVSSPAHAQSALGNFTLPYEARWGKMLLSPGVYTFSLKSPSLPAPLMVGKEGGSRIAVVLPQGISTEKFEEGSRLVLSHNARGELFVSALYLGDLGVILHYDAAKVERAAAETAKLVPPADSQPAK
jgi:hypothetical protein